MFWNCTERLPDELPTAKAAMTGVISSTIRTTSWPTLPSSCPLISALPITEPGKNDTEARPFARFRTTDDEPPALPKAPRLDEITMVVPLVGELPFEARCTRTEMVDGLALPTVTSDGSAEIEMFQVVGGVGGCGGPLPWPVGAVGESVEQPSASSRTMPATIDAPEVPLRRERLITILLPGLGDELDGEGRRGRLHGVAR